MLWRVVGRHTMNRVVSNGVTTTTYYVGNWFEVTEGVTTTYYYLGGQRVAMRRVPLQGEQQVTYLHSDHLGSTSAWGGSNCGSQAYYPFGLVRTTTGTLPTDVTFTGQRVDRSTAQNTAGTDGLLYYGARYYDSSLGRWAQADTVVPDVYDPQSLNRYAYALNNPTKYNDPSGHDTGCPGKEASQCAVKTTQALGLPRPAPKYDDADIARVAVIVTYESQLIAPQTDYAVYSAGAWTIRNRVEGQLNGVKSYSDGRLLAVYDAWASHKLDKPDPMAVEKARRVLDAQTHASDETKGSAYYRDQSFWTRQGYSENQIQEMVTAGKFTKTFEVRFSDGKVYGLYFFDTGSPPFPDSPPAMTPVRPKKVGELELEPRDDPYEGQFALSLY